ncbi:hypothetical protein [Promicromonospora soli]
MFGFTDYADYRRNEQDLDRRAEQNRVAREQRDAARRQADERRAGKHAARAKTSDAVRPRAA